MFILDARIVPGPAGDGIDPLNEGLVLTIGQISAPLTPWNNRSADETRGGLYRSLSTVTMPDGSYLDVSVTLRKVGDGSLQLNVQGDGTDLSGITDPVPVRLALGDDFGSTTIIAVTSP